MLDRPPFPPPGSPFIPTPAEVPRFKVTSSGRVRNLASIFPCSTGRGHVKKCSIVSASGRGRPGRRAGPHGRRQGAAPANKESVTHAQNNGSGGGGAGAARRGRFRRLPGGRRQAEVHHRRDHG